MEVKERNQQYSKYVEARSPKTKPWPSLFWAFIVGGIICVIGQLIGDLIKIIEPAMEQEMVSAWISGILVFLAAFLTAVGLYDNIGAVAGAGSIVPITGFSNSITSPAMEYKKEGIIFGICVKMFTIAGPVIVLGVCASVVVGIIYLFI